LLTLGSFSLPVGAATLAISCHGKNRSIQTGKLNIQYIRKEAPPFEIPPYLGASYEDTVPDTLDIAERCQLALNAATRATDPEADYEIYFWATPFHNPPIMKHDFSDWCLVVEGIMEGQPLLRTATGSDLNADVDAVWMQALLKCVGPDGLIYLPLDGRPWMREGAGNPPVVEPVWKANGTKARFNDPSVSQITTPCIWARALGTMGVYHVRDGNPMWKEAMQRMVDRAAALAVDQGDYAYYPGGSFEPNAKPGSDARLLMPSGGVAIDISNGRLIQGLAQCYKLTGYEPAARLAGKLVNFVRRHIQYYDEADGRFILDPGDKHEAKDKYELLFPSKAPKLNADLAAMKYGGHFHTHTIGLLSMIEYALAAGDRELLDWTKSSYEWARTQGGPLVGFMPSEIVPLWPNCESCEVGDMIQIALKLTDAGVGDYWDDVDRWARNQFAENQLTSPDWVYRVAERFPPQPIPPYHSGDHVPERNLGAFAGWASGSDWTIGPEPLMIMQCCNGNSNRALYSLWEHILEHKDGRLRANLLLNRASQWADLHSHIPYQGQVDMKMKRACPEILVHVPEWIRSGSAEVKVLANGKPRALRWEGRFVEVGPGLPGETITVAFPQPARKVTATLGAVAYKLELKGNTVVSIDPPGKNGPLYQRAAYRESRVPWRKVQRFVPETEIAW
jgi:hypothetical protein